MTPITDIGVDLDGVLYPFIEVFRLHCIHKLKRSPKELTMPTRWEFYEDWGMTEDEFNRHLTTAITKHQIFNQFPCEYRSNEAFTKLRLMGIGIHVITHRPDSAQEQTIQWLTKQRLLPNTVHFSGDKTILETIADGASVLIDDHYHYYQQVEGTSITPFLQTRPWNTSFKNVRRVGSLYELAELIEKHNTGETNVHLAPAYV
jgi:hypothetical protein